VAGGRIGAKTSHIAAATAVVVAALVATAGTAAADQVIGSGTVVPLTNPGPGLARPADGRLRGVALAGEVTGIGFAGRADVGDAGLVMAAAGDQLVLFTVQVTEPTTFSYLDSTLTHATPTATLIEGTARIPLDVSSGLLGDITKGWAAAIPKGVPVRLELAKAGYAQTFDLRTGRRVGPDPVALYRDPTKPDLSVSLGATQTLAATTSAGGRVSYQVELHGATLSYFSPDPRTPPPGPDRGFLILNLQTANSTASPINPTIDAAAPLPGSRIRLQLADGTQIAATHRNDPLGASGLLDGI
jgi:hypothetical protein